MATKKVFEVKSGNLISYNGKEDIVVLPDNVKRCDKFAFCSCKIREIVLPSGFNGDINFSSLNTLETITVSEGNKKYFSCDGVLYRKKKVGGQDKIILECYPRSKKDEKYVMPDYVTEISEDAFWGAKYLKEVTICDNIEKNMMGGFSFGIEPVIDTFVIPSICPLNIRSLSRKGKKGQRKIIVYPSKRKECPKGFTSIYEEDGVTYAREYSTFPVTGKPMYWYTVIDCDENKTGDVFLPYGTTQVLKQAFANCKKITSIIWPKFYPDVCSHDFDIDEDLIIPLVFPMVELSYAKDDTMKHNMALGYLAHSEYYDDEWVGFMSETVGRKYASFVSRKRKELVPLICKLDRPDLLKYYAERCYITPKNFNDLYMNSAKKENSIKCEKFLNDWKKEHI